MTTPRSAPPHLMFQPDEDGTVHLVNEQARFVKNEAGDLTLRVQCGAIVVYKRVLAQEETTDHDCAACWATVSP